MLTTALQISRAEAGLGREQFADTRIAEMLDDLADMYGPVAEDQDMTISVSVDPALHVPLHRELMSQAIGNLIENALKYATGGHEIKLSAQDDGGTVVLSVADDGAGIPAERRNEAMQRFQRLDPARRVPGSGLGLSLVEAIARLHNGDVTLSDNAPGLCVTIRIKP
jgi:signal transduction histidine kinase